MKKLIGIALCLALVLSLVGCGAKHIPSPEEVSRYSAEELSSFAKSVRQKDLLENWGEPKSVNNLRLWPVEPDGETKYVIAALENGEVTSVGVSFPLFVTVVQGTDTVAKGLVGIEDYSKDPSMLTYLPLQDAFGNEIRYEPGDLYFFQFDGRIMETYPQQIAPPYSATRMGCLSEEDFSELRDLLSREMTEFIA